MKRLAFLCFATLACSSGSDKARDMPGPAPERSWFVEIVPPTVSSQVPLELEGVALAGTTDLTLPAIHAVVGHVVESDGSAVVARVSAWRPSKIPGRPAHLVEASDTGSGFEFATPADRYTLRVVTKTSPPRPPREFSLDLGGATTKFELRMPPASELRSVAGVVAQVVDAANRIPIGGLSVKAVDRATGRVASTTTVTGSDGSFRFQVWKSEAAYDLVVEPSTMAPGFPTLRRTFEPAILEPDEHGDLALGVVAMPPYTSPQPYRFVVRGSPDNGDDVPVPGSRLTLETTLVSAVDSAASELPAAEFSVTGQVGTDGRVELMLVPPDPGMTTRTYTLRVQPPAGSDFATVEDPAFSLDNTTGRAQVLRLPSKVRLSGAVRAGDGKPVENAVVEAVPTQDGTLSLAAMSDGVAATATTDAAGKYVLRVDRGRFDVRVKPPQGSPYPRESEEGVMITEGIDLPLDLPLGGKAVGLLLTDTGSTLSMVEIRFYVAAEDGKSAARLRGVTQTTETGSYEVILP